MEDQYPDRPADWKMDYGTMNVTDYKGVQLGDLNRDKRNYADLWKRFSERFWNQESRILGHGNINQAWAEREHQKQITDNER